ncbi:porin [Gammaproteobacteria bacterium]|nr:porin [Gammaproteobacteria bacterium]
MFNKKLIAATVAAAVGASLAPQAMADITVYGRINNAVEYTDKYDGVEGRDWDVANVSSRFGLKGSADLGNGLQAIGRYEFATDTDIEGTGVQDTRLGYVGLTGGFGTVTIGNQWSAYYNTVGTNLDPSYSLAYYLFTATGGFYRTSNTIKYATDAGGLHAEVDFRLGGDAGDANTEGGGGENTGEELDGYALGLTYGIAGVNLSFAYDVINAPANDNKRMAFNAGYDFGPVALNLGYQVNDQGNGTDDNNAIIGRVSGSLSDSTSWMAMYGTGEVDYDVDEFTIVDNADADQITLGVYHNMGGGFKMYMEGTNYDVSGKSDFSQVYFGMRFDF